MAPRRGATSKKSFIFNQTARLIVTQQSVNLIQNMFASFLKWMYSKRSFACVQTRSFKFTPKSQVCFSRLARGERARRHACATRKRHLIRARCERAPAGGTCRRLPACARVRGVRLRAGCCVLGLKPCSSLKGRGVCHTLVFEVSQL